MYVSIRGSRSVGGLKDKLYILAGDIIDLKRTGLQYLASYNYTQAIDDDTSRFLPLETHSHDSESLSPRELRLGYIRQTSAHVLIVEPGEHRS